MPLSFASRMSGVSCVALGLFGALVSFGGAAPLGGCIHAAGDSGSATGASPSGDGGGSGLVDGGAAGPTAQGADCIVDPTSGVHICSAISICPRVVVNHDVYPNCGWRIHGQALDLECACSGMVCPIGSPTTCDQAAKLLADQSELQVCQQVSESRCTAGPASSSSSGGTPPTSGCDATCAAECHNAPSCLRLCGC